MRRDEEKKFKVRSIIRTTTSAYNLCNDAQGSVFVEFADFSSVEAFLKADPKPTWEGKELLIMSKYVLPLITLGYSLIIQQGRLLRNEDQRKGSHRQGS